MNNKYPKIKPAPPRESGFDQNGFEWGSYPSEFDIIITLNEIVIYKLVDSNYHLNNIFQINSKNDFENLPENYKEMYVKFLERNIDIDVKHWTEYL
jgi:hypothetical protein